MRKKFKFGVYVFVIGLFFNILALNIKVSGLNNQVLDLRTDIELARVNIQKSYFHSLQDASVDLERPFLLIFFNVSCHICWDELFVWKEFVETRQIPVQLVGVTRDPEEAVSHFLKKYSLTFPIIVDRQGRVFRLYRVRSEPFLILGRGQEIIYKDNLMEPMAKRREKLERCLLALH